MSKFPSCNMHAKLKLLQSRRSNKIKIHLQMYEILVVEIFRFINNQGHK
jgi:hypothetical protein